MSREPGRSNTGGESSSKKTRPVRHIFSRKTTTQGQLHQVTCCCCACQMLPDDPEKEEPDKDGGEYFLLNISSHQLLHHMHLTCSSTHLAYARQCMCLIVHQSRMQTNKHTGTTSSKNDILAGSTITSVEGWEKDVHGSDDDFPLPTEPATVADVMLARPPQVRTSSSSSY